MSFIRRRIVLPLAALCIAVAGFLTLASEPVQAYRGMPPAYKAYWAWVSTLGEQDGRAVTEGIELLARYPGLNPLYLRLAGVCGTAQRAACEAAVRTVRPPDAAAAQYQQAALALLADDGKAGARWAQLAQDPTLSLPLVRLVIEHGAGTLGMEAARAQWIEKLADDSTLAAPAFGIALAAIAEGDWATAETHLRRITRHVPHAAEAYRELGRVYFYTGRSEALRAALLQGIAAAEARYDYEQVLVLRGNLALALMQSGTELDLAETLLTDALVQSRQLADANRITLTLYRLATLRAQQVRYHDALTLLDSARVYMPHEAAPLQTQVLALQGTVEWALFRFSDAQQTLETARAQAQQQGLVLEEVQAMASLAQLRYRLGHYEAARALGIEALQKATARTFADAMIAARMVLGDIESASGNLDKAVSQYQAALELAQTHQMVTRIQEAGTRLAQVMLELKDPVGANQVLDRVLEHIPHSARVYDGMGRIYQAHGNYPRALDYFRMGVEKAGADEGLKAALYVNQAWAYMSLYDLEGAGTALAQARGALARSGNHPQARLLVEAAAAALYYDAGDYARAQAAYGRTLTLAQQVKAPAYQWQLLHGAALSAWRLGQKAEAERAFRSAISLIEALRDNLNDGQRRASFVQDKVLVYKNFVAFLNEQGRTGEAFHYAERVRSRGLADLFTTTLSARAYDAGSAEMRLVEARRRQQALASNLGDVGAGGTLSATDQVRAGQLRREFSRADSLYQTSFSALPGDGVFTALSAPVRVEAVQNVLRPSEALVLYTMAAPHQVQGQDEMQAYVITRDSVQTITLPAQAGEMRRSISIFRDQLSASNRGPGRGWEPTSRRLYDQLMAPVVAVLPAGVTHLNIVPEGELHYLPFAALRDARGRFLVERYSISSAPSASMFCLARARSQENKGRWRRVVALADPEGRLPGTRREVRALSRIKAIRVDELIGAQATEANLKMFAPEADILHIATHGHFNPRTPWSSALELHGGNLSVAEIGQIGLDRPYLVVLSACETALGSGAHADVPQGDEWIGMNQAFMAAGAPAVMSSLWPISDRASSTLIPAFYNALLDTGGKAEALARVQRAFIRDAVFAHPYYWAAFSLTGDPL